MKSRVQKLVAKAQKGDRRAFGQLVSQYQEKLLYLGYDLMGNWEDARDAAQNSFVKAFEKLPAFEGRAHFSTWLYRIMVNQCRDLQRKNSRARMDYYENDGLELAAENQLASSKTGVNVMQKLENTELRFQLEQAMQQLSINQRTAISLRFFHEYSTTEIAEIMTCSENTVRIHMFRGLNKLKEILPKMNIN